MGKLAWETSGETFTADAFSPSRRYAGSYRLSKPPGATHWQVDFLPPAQGSAVEDCGFGISPDVAKGIAEEHHANRWLVTLPTLP